MKLSNTFARRIAPVFFWALLVMSALYSTATAQTTTFTYQGRLTDASTPANGTYDFEFALYDQSNALIATIQRSGVTVSNGAFTVQLDFGSTAFPGANRFLEIRVKRQADATYTALAPRQQITSAPYAIRAANAGTADALSPACVSCVTNAQINSVDGAKVSGAVANATAADTSTTASSVSSSAGDSVVAAINASSSSVMTSHVTGDVELAPSAQQTVSTTNNLVNLKLIGARTLGQPGQDALLSLSASGTYADGGTYDKERFRVDNDGSILSVADFTGGINTTAPIEGSGTRFMWYGAKAALRAGQINGTQWDDANIGLYSTAFGENVRALGDNSIVVGKNSVAANTGTVALGEGHTATGANSVALGYGASTSTIAGSPRTGTFVFSDRSVPLTYSFNSTTPDIGSQFHPTVTNSFNVRAVNGSFFYTNTALTTGFIFNSTTATMTLTNSKLSMSSDGSTTLTSNSGGTSGVSLPAGGGAWNSLSDRNMKDNFKAVNSRDILNRVLKLPISTWNYKTQNASIRHIGVMAQDFKAAFAVGEDDRHISTIDPDGVALAAIQGLNAELNEQTAKLKKQNATLQTQVAAQKAQLNEFETRLKRLEQQTAKPHRIVKRRK